MDVRDQIEKTELPAFVANLRQQTRKVQAGNIRQLFRTLGIKNVSVTTRISSIRIKLPKTEHIVPEGTTHIFRSNCSDCQRLLPVREKLEKIILSAFPDLDDRSDLMTDYFNFCFMID